MLEEMVWYMHREKTQSSSNTEKAYLLLLTTLPCSLHFFDSTIKNENRKEADGTQLKMNELRAGKNVLSKTFVQKVTAVAPR